MISPRERHASRNNWRRRFLAISLAAAVAVPSALSVPAASAAVSSTVADAEAASDPVADGSKSEEDYALEQAAATGQPYELLSARTESSDTWALPDGTWSVKRHGTPVRMLRNGAWIPTDPTLQFAPDGRVSPKASTVAVSFSGGGSGPMLTGVKDGRTLSLTWPKALPKPTLAENVATYADVLPGVDLQLKAEVEGFSQLLVVNTPEAARNPELASLKYELDTVGVTVSTDSETGTVTAANPAGQTVFTSPSPLMWDSTTITSAGTSSAVKALASEGETPADAFVPPPGAQDAHMPTTVSGDTLEITPDQELLTGSDTRYPVYIDPSWAWGERQNWTRVYKAYPKNSYWNSKDVLRVGYEAQSGGSNRISRSFFQLGVADVKSAKIKSATFRIRNTWSWSCQSRPVELHSVGAISKKTTWNNQPTKGALLDTVNDSKGWSQTEDCAAGNLEFDATSPVATAAAKGAASINLGLYASNEADTFGWKKFDPKSFTLEIKYNNPPKKPSGLGTNPRTACTGGGLIGNARVSIYAKIDDKDAGNLTAQYQVFKSGSSTALVDKSIPAAKGKIATLAVPDVYLPTGSYTWRVRGKDHDGDYSPWSTTCTFDVDRTRPGNPPVITSSDGKFPSGEAGWPTVTGKAREAGQFTFAPNGVTDVDHYIWFTDHQPDLGTAAPGTPVTITPPGYGPHLVHAYSVDKAGNRSDTATYLYYATRSTTRDEPGDLNGDGHRDIWSIDSNGTLLTYAGQGNGDFASATNGGGRSFAGASVNSRGDWGQDGYNDLVVLESSEANQNKRLRTYSNAAGNGVVEEASATELTVSCPIKDPGLGCDYGEDWDGDDHWHNAEQVVTPGDLNGDGNPDLLVKQGKRLWAYYGNRTTMMLDSGRAPVLVGDSDWDRFTVIAPGDLNNDQVPDLWLRDDTSGDVYRADGKRGPDGYLDPTTWGTANRTKIATGFTATAYPAIGSVGDVTGDSLADLWARKADNTMYGWPGKTPGSDGITFGSAYQIDGVTGGTHIPAGTTLTAGQSYTTRSAKLTMQDDGNLVITSNADNVLWQSKTGGNPGAKAVMQSDGNLAVISSSDARLWSTNLVKSSADGPGIVTPELTAHGYALLQDRGNLVLYNAKGQSVWSSGTHTRHDYNNDGRSDIANWYSFHDDHDGLHTFLTNSDGAFKDPFVSYESPVNMWNINTMKTVTGDFNGDGHGDMAVWYTYSDNSAKLFTALGKPDGGFNTPVASWKSAPNSWHLPFVTLESGDFNGDGRDDIAVWYAYSAGHDTLFTFTANIKGGFNAPFASHTQQAGRWDVKESKFATGDFDGDGRDDLAALYGYPDGSLKMHTFRTNPTGGFTSNVMSWTSTNWGSFDRSIVHAGDFNGDGIDDIAVWYDRADGKDALHTLTSLSNRDGTFSAPTQGWISAEGVNWYNPHIQIVPGDYNGDGRDDIGAMYGYDNGTVRMFTWISTANGTFTPPTAGWSTPSGWTFSNVTLLRPYN
ncbi:FG-GAP-like repeat-containing protein [Streptomyces sp. 111WW2]|uniref:FG-GAP-like repeat-containing protein n=1 Tax=Streptomyces sp. 111WW2 TaxID=1945515 RepID=UPI00237BC96A|nr:FG-GAP-like repeat-containing protein [Streptomyces sp. 111WW2]